MSFVSIQVAACSSSLILFNGYKTAQKSILRIQSVILTNGYYYLNVLTHLITEFIP